MIGRKIHYYRLKKNMTQEQLANGICSISYLSKIENNILVPSEEISKLLLKKLGFKREIQTDESYNLEFLESVLNWRQAISLSCIEKADKQYKELKRKVENIEDFELVVFYHIVEIYYFIATNNRKKCETIHSKIQLYIDSIKMEYKHHYYHVMGILEYHKNNLDESVKLYKKALSYCIHPKEISEIHYRLGQVHTKQSQFYLSNHYIKKALSFYKDHFFLVECIDCHLIFAVNFRHTQMYEEAKQHLSKALKLIKSLKDDRGRYTIVYHNLGYIYYDEGDDRNAIRYLFMSLELDASDSLSKLQTYCVLTRVYLRQQNKKQATFWFQKASELLEEKHPFSTEEYDHHLAYLQSIIEELGSSRIIHLLSKQIIPFFKKSNNIHFMREYVALLASYYYKDGKYKKASECYRELYSLGENS